MRSNKELNCIVCKFCLHKNQLRSKSNLNCFVFQSKYCSKEENHCHLCKICLFCQCKFISKEISFCQICNFCSHMSQISSKRELFCYNLDSSKKQFYISTCILSCEYNRSCEFGKRYLSSNLTLESFCTFELSELLRNNRMSTYHLMSNLATQPSPDGKEMFKNNSPLLSNLDPYPSTDGNETSKSNYSSPKLRILSIGDTCLSTDKHAITRESSKNSNVIFKINNSYNIDLMLYIFVTIVYDSVTLNIMKEYFSIIFNNG